MFGIGELKDSVAALRVQDLAIIEGTRKMSAEITKLTKQVAELSESLTLVNQSANAAITPHRADELAVAISKCSLDMAELDRRLCALEDAQTFTMAYRDNNDAPALSERDKAFSPNAVLIPREPATKDKAGAAIQQMLPLRQRTRHKQAWVARWRAYCEEMTVRDAEIIEAVSQKQDRHGNRFNEDMLRASYAGGIILHLRTNPAVTLRHASYIEAPTKRSDGKTITRRYIVSVPDCEYGGVIRIGMETEVMAELICDQWNEYVTTLRAEIVAQEKKGKGKQ